MTAVIWSPCLSCGVARGAGCRDANNNPAPPCRGRVRVFRCCGCRKDLPAAFRRATSRFPCCGKPECKKAAKKKWARADRACKNAVERARKLGEHMDAIVGVM